MKSKLPDKATHKTIRVTAESVSTYEISINVPIQAHPHDITAFVRSGAVDVTGMTEDGWGEWNWLAPEETDFDFDAEDLYYDFLGEHPETKEIE
jgi:hypothetical protein